jgi:hypothetical protein
MLTPGGLNLYFYGKSHVHGRFFGNFSKVFLTVLRVSSFLEILVTNMDYADFDLLDGFDALLAISVGLFYDSWLR